MEVILCGLLGILGGSPSRYHIPSGYQVWRELGILLLSKAGVHVKGQIGPVPTFCDMVSCAEKKERCQRNAGVSAAHPPIFAGPAERYVMMRTPVVVLFDLTSVKLRGGTPFSNNRFPPPRTTGATQKAKLDEYNQHVLEKSLPPGILLLNASAAGD